MMSWRRLDWRTLAAGSILGAPSINAFRRALIDARLGYSREHVGGTALSAGGAHDSRLISRGIGTVTESSGSYTLAENHGNIASISKTGTGVVRVTMSPGMSGTDYTPWAGVRRTAAQTGGYICQCVPVSATTFDVYVGQVLRDSGTASFVAADHGFFVEVKGGVATPLVASGSQYFPEPDIDSRLPYSDIVTREDVSGIAETLEGAADAFLVGHTAAGEHDDPLIAKGWLIGVYDPEAEAYAFEYAGIVSAAAKNASGGVDVTIDEMDDTTYFIGHHPMGGQLETSAPARGHWTGHWTTGRAVSTTAVEIGIARLRDAEGGAYLDSHGGIFVEIKGVLA